MTDHHHFLSVLWRKTEYFVFVYCVKIYNYKRQICTKHCLVWSGQEMVAHLKILLLGAKIKLTVLYLSNLTNGVVQVERINSQINSSEICFDSAVPIFFFAHISPFQPTFNNSRRHSKCKASKNATFQLLVCWSLWPLHLKLVFFYQI